MHFDQYFLANFAQTFEELYNISCHYYFHVKRFEHLLAKCTVYRLTCRCNTGHSYTLLHQGFGYVHLSAGDLLRAERNKPNSQVGALIEKHITEGSIVPVKITCRLLAQVCVILPMLCNNIFLVYFCLFIDCHIFVSFTLLEWFLYLSF